MINNINENNIIRKYRINTLSTHFINITQYRWNEKKAVVDRTFQVINNIMYDTKTNQILNTKCMVL